MSSLLPYVMKLYFNTAIWEQLYDAGRPLWF